LKILRIERCNHCKFFDFMPGSFLEMNRFKCSNPDTVRKNGNYRIINRDIAMRGKITTWCGLEDYPV